MNIRKLSKDFYYLSLMVFVFLCSALSLFWIFTSTAPNSIILQILAFAIITTAVFCGCYIFGSLGRKMLQRRLESGEQRVEIFRQSLQISLLVFILMLLEKFHILNFWISVELLVLFISWEYLVPTFIKNKSK